MNRYQASRPNLPFILSPNALRHYLPAVKLSCYVHVPFCARICTYCDFYRIVHDPVWERRYVDAICAEMEIRFEQLRESHLGEEITLDTLFFGGGTPTVLSSESWSSLISRIKQFARFSPDIEFTSEANPESATTEKLLLLASLGVNRISFGAQSFNSANLERLGRLHNAEQVGVAVNNARQVGINNISIDLMYGLPDETDTSLESDLCTVVDLMPQHISFYSLMLEGNVPLRYQVERREVPLPTDDLVADRYQRAVDFLTQCGFEHYEISNYACNNQRCRHNLAYWLQRDYIAFGPAAVSTIGNRRFKNKPDIYRYVKNLTMKKLPIADEEEVTAPKRLIETIMLSLRLSDGLDTGTLKSEFGYDISSKRCSLIDGLKSEGDIIVEGDLLRLTTKGMFRADMIASSLLPDFV